MLTIPTVELTKIDGTEGDSAMNQQVVKKSKKQWVLNPNGKSMVSILMFSFIVTKIGTFLNMFFFFKVKHANLFYAFFMGEGTRLGIIISDSSSWL